MTIIIITIIYYWKSRD